MCKKGLSLVEILCVVSLIPIVIFGITSGITVLKNLQYRTDSLMRLSYAAGGVMEQWKAKSFDDLKAGKYEIKVTNLKPQDKIIVTICDTKQKDLKEIIVEAEHSDARHPQKIKLTTLVVK